ncbi:tryptophan synthase subunit alpha [Neopusillimonas maritima]|jgi:tryptophan synthase alpha chain|uniref:Tryptophan synthase alpha chain n=1 Tax=Neopusillimonas maritima TaxID=2026239 RepID=A0ABX9MYZ3_9BURK|nr:tryptophan synthase subunit alpha [Neopusillimonas maritima]MAL01710.1 tryptophan synthase subunit alpha [Alcaligenaceae bacterium]RII84114.1 tryptophan synthase subunit alpha [Neopusillimonas maritima]|tara:strand:- start:90283 stop:91119 length:837 start_codon:yes stop_codon:yes gene_type:complete
MSQVTQAQADRLAAAFAKTKGRAALIPYITAGDPSPQATVPLMHALVAAGADVIELGVPFSDPMADGPVVQRATQRAIEKGVGMRHVFDMVQAFRESDKTTPVVLMGYANPVERYGQLEFARKAQEVGVDGVLVVDYPPEEMLEFARYLDDVDVAPIFLLAPTSTDARIQKVAEIARGYVYYVSLKGVTGAATIDLSEVEQRVQAIRRHVSIPIGVGFGIRDAQSAQRVGQVCDAVIIGSKLIETMEEAVARANGHEADQAAVKAAGAWLAGIRQALG